MRLAKFWKCGSIWINPQVKGESRRRVQRHMRTFQKARAEGDSRAEAIRKARKSEHRGMTAHQVQVYEGRLSAIARRKT
jgi:hypothetical protein